MPKLIAAYQLLHGTKVTQVIYVRQIPQYCLQCKCTVLSMFAMQLSALITELASAGEAELKVQLDEGVIERLLAYSRSVASFPTAVKEVRPHQHGRTSHHSRSLLSDCFSCCLPSSSSAKRVKVRIPYVLP